MNENNINSDKNGDLKRFYQAMAILRQKIKTLLDSTPDLLTINNLKELPLEKVESVEDQLWDIYAFGEYYVKKIVSDLSELGTITATISGKGHFDYHREEYKTSIEGICELIDMSEVPTRREAELALIFAIDDGHARVLRDRWTKEITEGDIADYLASDHLIRTTKDDEGEVPELRTGFDFKPVLILTAERDEICSGMDIYMDAALNGCLQDCIRTHTTNSEENTDIKTGFKNMLEVMRNYQYKITEAGEPNMESFKCLAGGNVGEVRERENENERRASDLKLSDCEKILGKSYFEPDKWIANEKKLSPPAVINRELEKIPRHIRDRIDEIHRSFIFGNWISVIALSRCLLEYAISDRKAFLQIELYSDPEHKKRKKRLKILVSEVKEVFPELDNDMERIIEEGNSVMHYKKPRKKSLDNIVKIPLYKAEAKNCIDDITKIISTLYGSKQNFQQPR